MNSPEEKIQKMDNVASKFVLLDLVVAGSVMIFAGIAHSPFWYFMGVAGLIIALLRPAERFYRWMKKKYIYCS